jgi:hypothetical protein
MYIDIGMRHPLRTKSIEWIILSAWFYLEESQHGIPSSESAGDANARWGDEQFRINQIIKSKQKKLTNKINAGENSVHYIASAHTKHANIQMKQE